MAFSPETYALLKLNLNAAETEIANLKTGKWGITISTPSAGLTAVLNNMYNAATNKALVTQVATSGSTCFALYGVRNDDAKTQKFLYIASSTATAPFGIAVRTNNDDVISWELHEFEG